MSIYDFIKMDEMEQSEAIWSGKLAGTREDNEYRILLYKIDDFYVEVFYHKEHNVIKRFRPFKNKEELQPYFNVNPN